MSVRVVARIRPLLKTERESDVIVSSGCSTTSTNHDVACKPTGSTTTLNKKKPKEGKGNSRSDSPTATSVRIPNPKNEAEEYNFQFAGVYDANAGQQEIFDAEVAPAVKHLFSGFDVTLFAYGVTGTGKTHTMRGGKSLADRGVIPRLLSSVFRRSRKIEKDTQGATNVEISMSYYEIYNDKIFDLFEPPEKRTPSGLPLRDNGGKTVVVGLSERPCTSLKEFELLYDQANMNRSTSATKLNAHSSRSHAILCVKVAITTGDETCISTASAIDLAGSEDNRRTGNGKERMVESASINKSLFVLAQCVEAMTKKQSRIPYRESKMTRILSLGQNNGLTVMILNLAPVRSYHLDTLTSLNFANRTKKVEVKEVENQPRSKDSSKTNAGISSVTGSSIQRQPLRPLASSINVNVAATTAAAKPEDTKPAKAFSVYTDKTQMRASMKRGSETLHSTTSRPLKATRVADATHHSLNDFSAAKIEEMVQKKVEEVLAARASDDANRTRQEVLLTRSGEINEQVQRRLESLEKRLEGKEDARSEGLSYLLMGKQHQSRGEDSSALKMYRLAQPFFPDNEKLAGKIEKLDEKLASRPRPLAPKAAGDHLNSRQQRRKQLGRSNRASEYDSDDEYEYQEPYSDEEFGAADFECEALPKKTATRKPGMFPSKTTGRRITETLDDQENHTPRTTHILSVVNSRNVSDIQLLRGIGKRKAGDIVDCLREIDNEREITSEHLTQVRTLAELGKLKGVGMKTVDNMRSAIDTWGRPES